MTMPDRPHMPKDEAYWNGYYEGHMAVAIRHGDWVLRARLETDRPVHESEDAMRAMAEWKWRNGEKFRSLGNG